MKIIFLIMLFFTMSVESYGQDINNQYILANQLTLNDLFYISDEQLEEYLKRNVKYQEHVRDTDIDKCPEVPGVVLGTHEFRKGDKLYGYYFSNNKHSNSFSSLQKESRRENGLIDGQNYFTKESLCNVFIDNNKKVLKFKGKKRKDMIRYLFQMRIAPESLF